MPATAGAVHRRSGPAALDRALARAALADQASRPILQATGYGLPSWITPDTTVLCASYL